MKRLRTLAIVVGVLAVAWFALGRPISNRIRQNSASVHMLNVYNR